MLTPEFLWTSQLVVAAVMTGIIWQVQLVTYPQFLRVSPADFPAYHEAHTRGMGWVVVPPMLTELTLAVLTVWQLRTSLSWIGLGFVAALWLSTGLIQVPLHDQLGRVSDRTAMERLIRTNWLRTFLWTARTVFIGVIVFRSF